MLRAPLFELLFYLPQLALSLDQKTNLFERLHQTAVSLQLFAKKSKRLNYSLALFAQKFSTPVAILPMITLKNGIKVACTLQTVNSSSQSRPRFGI